MRKDLLVLIYFRASFDEISGFNSSSLLFFIDNLNEFPIQPNPNYNIDSKLQ